jgi:hypothetical protein
MDKLYQRRHLRFKGGPSYSPLGISDFGYHDFNYIKGRNVLHVQYGYTLHFVQRGSGTLKILDKSIKNGESPVAAVSWVSSGHFSIIAPKIHPYAFSTKNGLVHASIIGAARHTVRLMAAIILIGFAMLLKNPTLQPTRAPIRTINANKPSTNVKEAKSIGDSFLSKFDTLNIILII